MAAAALSADDAALLKKAQAAFKPVPSHAHGWQKGPHNSPTVLNAVFNIAQFWDGRAKDLQEQAMGPVQAAVERHSTPQRTVDVLRSIPEYTDDFKRSFPGEADPVTFRNMAAAIEVCEATLLTPNARFDQFLTGKSDALNATEKSCHSGVNLGGTGYFPFAVVEKPGSDVFPRITKACLRRQRRRATNTGSSRLRCVTLR